MLFVLLRANQSKEMGRGGGFGLVLCFPLADCPSAILDENLVVYYVGLCTLRRRLLLLLLLFILKKEKTPMKMVVIQDFFSFLL
jgi:hypothetical protein